MNDDTKGTDGKSVGSNDLLGGTAWLVEMLTGYGCGNYWCPRNEGNWTTVDNAVRFSRKDDAERVILMLREQDRRSGRLIDYVATEHEWVPPNAELSGAGHIRNRKRAAVSPRPPRTTCYAYNPPKQDRV